MADNKPVSARLCCFLIIATVWLAAMTAAPAQSIAPSAPISAPGPNASTERHDRPARDCDTLQTMVVGPNAPRHAPLLSVHVKSDGSMHDPVLVASSGDGDVDQAALSCADGNHVSSLADSRIPAETTWVLGYYWSRGWSGFAPANPDGKRADSCEQHPFARAAGGELAVNDTTVTYIIGTNGRVKNIAVVASSGTPDLDRQVANCVSAWRFFPIYRDGDAVEVERNFTVNWQVE